jgi:hypothetical protein
MFGRLPDRSHSSTGPHFIFQDQAFPLGAFAGYPLLVVPEADEAEALDTQDMLRSMPQGAFTVRPRAKAAKTKAACAIAKVAANSEV